MDRQSNLSNTKYRKKFVDCSRGVVYSISLSCGQRYVGQTGGCLNVRLQEHSQEVQKGREGFLGMHCSQCGCFPLVDKAAVLARNAHDNTRIVIDAAAITRGNCISKPFIALTDKELAYLESSASGVGGTEG